jgi:hypothetical protein
MDLRNFSERAIVLCGLSKACATCRSDSSYLRSIERNGTVAETRNLFEPDRAE